MKTMKRLGCLLLALVMCLALGVSVFAADFGTYTITIENSVFGETYTAYKIFDATVDESSGAVAYTIKPDSIWLSVVQNAYEVFTLTAYPKDVTENDVEYYTVTANNDDNSIIAVFINAIHYNENDGSYYVGESELTAEFIAARDFGNSAELTLNVSSSGAGYYFVTTTTGATVSLTTTNPKATIIDKNQLPAGSTLKKEIVHNSGNVTAESDAMGDNVAFKIESYVPLYDGDKIVYEYIFTDTMDDGLVLDVPAELVDDYVTTSGEGSDKIYMLTEKGMDAWITLEDARGITYEFTEVVFNASLVLTDVDEDSDGNITAHGFTLTYYTYNTKAYKTDGTFDTSAYPKDATIYITYSGHVTDEAGYKNENVVVINYYVTDLKNPDPEPEPEDQTPGTNDGNGSEDDIYTWELEVVKIDGMTETPLAGAKFKLEGENLNHVMISTSYTYTELQNPYQVQGGVTYYYLLVTGEYTRVAPTSETEENYESLNPWTRAAEEHIEVVETDNTSVTGTTDKNGELTFAGLTVGTYTLTEIDAPGGYNILVDPITIEVSWSEKDGFAVTSEDLEFNNSETGVFSVKIKNNAGEELPGTGGIGTTIFYVLGAILVCGAAVVLVTRRRVNGKAGNTRG